MLPILSNSSELQIYIKEINKIPLLSLEEEQCLFAKYQDQGDLKSAQKLITSHLKLVVKIAFSYKNYGISLMDIISEGNIGLMRSIKKFDIKKGVRLSTYAMLWIKAQIQEYILKSWSLVKIGTTAAQKKIFFNLSKVKKKILDYSGASLSEDNIKDMAVEMGVSIKDTKEMLSRLGQADIYLEDKIKNEEEEESSSLLDTIILEQATQEEIVLKNQETENKRNILYKSMQILNDREKEVIYARKLSEKAITLKDLSNKYNISLERVRQIEERALEKITVFFKNNYYE